MKTFNTNNEENNDLYQFAQFIVGKEKQLNQIFSNLDENKDGKLDFDEIKQSVNNLYSITVTDDEIYTMLKLIDIEDASISYPEWQRFILLVPTHSFDDQNREIIFDSWKKVSVDIGENLSIPINNKSKGEWWHFVIAGGLAGGVSRTATAPLDRIKTVLQLSKGEGGKAKFIPVTKAIYNGGLAQGGLLGGIRGFFRGNGTNCIKIIPESSIKFFTYESVKKILSGENNKNLGGLERFFSGATAGAISQAVIYPLEVIKTRMAAPNSPYRGISHCFFTSIRSSDGFLSLYKGLSPSLLGIIPYAGIDLAVYEYLRVRYAKFVETRKEVVGEKAILLSPLVCGTVSSSVAQLVSYPLGLVRTRLQAQVIPSSPAAGVPAIQPYNGMIDVFKRTIREEGLKGLYRGILPNYLKVIPAVSISYAMYEYMKKHFGLVV